MDVDVSTRVESPTRKAVGNACAIALYAVADSRKLLRGSGASFHKGVITTHGDHIPASVRDHAIVLFWLPEVLLWCADKELAANGWKVHLRRMPIALAYIANQLSMYEWPNTENTMAQHQRLMCTWSKLLQLPEVARSAWILARPRLDAGPNFETGRTFSWTCWWMMAHTDTRGCPSGCEAAFTLFHLWGGSVCRKPVPNQ